MAKKLSKAARRCVSTKTKKHCRKKRGRCRVASDRAQAVAIAFSQCRRRGFHIAKR